MSSSTPGLYEFYTDLQEKGDFINKYAKENRCTDLQIKFFKSVIDGKVKFVKHALNIGSIRNNYGTMRASINLACRFGHPQVLDCLLDKANDQFFSSAPGNLNYVVVVVAGVSEARRLERNEEPSGILDIIIKFARKSFDERKLKWVSGKIDLDQTVVLDGKDKITPFMELCGSRNSFMIYVIRKILDAEGNVVDVQKLINRPCIKNIDSTLEISALTLAVSSGNQEVIKIILDKMMEKSHLILHRINKQRDIQDCHKEALEKVMVINHHIQILLFWCFHFLIFSTRTNGVVDIDIIKLLIDKRFQVTRENKIGYDNEIFMKFYEKEGFMHDHFDAMISEVIEEEKRIAHANGKLTWSDLFHSEISPTKTQDVIEKYLRNPTDSEHFKIYFDQIERFSRSLDDSDFRYFDDLRTLLIELEEKRKCWSCGDRDSKLVVCKQCRRARYCDALCQDEHWKKHQSWCSETRNKMEKEREGETGEEREQRKYKQKLNKAKCNEVISMEVSVRSKMATMYQKACRLAQTGCFYL